MNNRPQGDEAEPLTRERIEAMTQAEKRVRIMELIYSGMDEADLNQVLEFITEVSRRGNS